MKGRDFSPAICQPAAMRLEPSRECQIVNPRFPRTYTILRTHAIPYLRPWIVVAFRRARLAAISRISRPIDVRFMIPCCATPIRLPTAQ